MIANALSFITKQLNAHFKDTLGLDHTMVALSRITNPNIDGKLLLTLIDIGEDVNIRNATGRTRSDTFIAMPPMSLNLDILIALAPRTPYVEGMKILSQAIIFFKERPVFNKAEGPMPPGIDRIHCEMLHLDANTKNAQWQILGANYQPSVVYRMRLVLLDTSLIEEEVIIGPPK